MQIPLLSVWHLSPALHYSAVREKQQAFQHSRGAAAGLEGEGIERSNYTIMSIKQAHITLTRAWGCNTSSYPPLLLLFWQKLLPEQSYSVIICLCPSSSDYSQTGISLIRIEMNILKVSSVLKGARAPLGLQIYCISKEHCSNKAAVISHEWGEKN